MIVSFLFGFVFFFQAIEKFEFSYFQKNTFFIKNKSKSHKMFYSLSSIKKPKKQFNLLHLEPNELYILSLGVSLIVDTTHEE